MRKGKPDRMPELIGKKKLFNDKFYRNSFILIGVVPIFTLYCIGVLVPNLGSILLSFFKWNGLNWKFTWMGLANYRNIFNDPIVTKAFWNNIYFAFFTMALTIGISLALAAILSSNTIKNPGLFTSIFYFPNIMSAVVVSLLWKFMYDPNLGIINAALEGMGLGELTRTWLGDINTVRPALVVPQVWACLGLYLLLYTTTIRQIDRSLYEAAELDGATKVQQFFRVTVPLIWPTIRLTMVYFMAGALNSGFAFIRVMTNGGPNRESEVLTSYLYQKAFQQGNYGFGAAMGVLILILGFTFYLLIEKVFKSETYEY